MRPLYAFVHGHIWLAHPLLLLDRGSRRNRIGEIGAQTLTSSVPKSRPVYQSAPPLDLPPQRPARVVLYHIATARRRPIKLWNESGTNRARIADSTLMRVRSRRYLDRTRLAATRSGIELPIH